MRYLLTALLFLCLTKIANGQFAGLIVNEFSQGNTGSREYIELLVVGNRTCTDSTADLRGWIFDDQNGWYQNGNGAPGHYRFPAIGNWAAVPFGSLILFYNSASGEKNASITLPDDPTDANKDYTYILPINANAYMEEHDAEPTGATNVAYIYPSASTTTGYAPTSNTWISHVALNNSGGDVISVISPSSRASAFFSIGYGITTVTPYRAPGVSIANVGSGSNAYLATANYASTTDWLIAAVSVNETPGLPNGGANTGWINKMRQQRPVITTAMASPVCFSLNTQTTSLAYAATNNADTYSISWNPIPSNNFVAVNNATLPSGNIILPIPAATIAGTYSGSVSVNNSSGQSCASVPFTITVLPQPVAPTVSVIDNCNNTSQLTASNFTGSLLWNTGASSSNIVVSVAGTYTVAQTINGCRSAVASVVANPSNSPAKPLINIVQPSCATAAGSFTITEPTGIDLQYSINGVNYQTSPSFTNLPSGLLSVTVRNTSGCVSPPTNVFILTTPNVPAAPVLSITHPTCNIATGSITVATPTGSGLSYSLNGGPFQSSPVFNALLPGTYNIRARSVQGCVSAMTTAVLVRSGTTVTNKINACIKQGESYTLGTQNITQSGNYNFTFRNSGGCDSIVQLQLLVSAVQTQRFSGCDSVFYNGVRYTNSVVLSDTLRSAITTCDSIYRITEIIVHKTPSPSIVFICRGVGGSYTFNGAVLTASGIYSAKFMTVNGCDSLVQLYLSITQAKDTTISGCQSVIYKNRIYTSSVILHEVISSAVTTCDSIQQTVHIFISPLPQLIVPPSQVICKGEAVTLKATSNVVTEWRGFGADSITVKPQVTTTYTAVSVNNAGCTNTATVVITVHKFDVHLSATPNPFFSGANVQLTASASSSFQVIGWQPARLFGGTTGTRPTIVADSTTDVFVWAKGSNGCVDSDTLQLVADPLGDIYVPTVFTPDGDGRNDLLKVLGGSFSSFDFKIYNRWGQVVFYTTERTRGWDGRMNGEQQPAQVYVYVLQGKLKNGVMVNKKGTVLLLR